MDYHLLYFIPPLIFALITGYCYFKMIGIATNHNYDSIPLFANLKFDDLRDIDKFKTITNHLKDKKKQKKYNRIYYSFIVCAILTPISMGLPLLIEIILADF